MGIKQDSISELRKKLADYNKVLNIGKGAKRKLKNLMNRISKEDYDLSKEVVANPKSKGLDMFGSTNSEDKRNHPDHPEKNGENTNSEEGLERDSKHAINIKKLEHENDLENMMSGK